MDSAKYQSDIIYDIEMACECVVFPQKGYIFAPCHHTKKIRTFLECKGIPFLDWPGILPDITPIENLWNLMHTVIANAQKDTNAI